MSYRGPQMREEGFYWVKWQGDWIIAFWDTNHDSDNKFQWVIAGLMSTLNDDEFDEIDENKLKR